MRGSRKRSFSGAGTEVLKKLKRRSSSCTPIVITAHSTRGEHTSRTLQRASDCPWTDTPLFIRNLFYTIWISAWKKITIAQNHFKLKMRQFGLITLNNFFVSFNDDKVRKDFVKISRIAKHKNSSVSYSSCEVNEEQVHWLNLDR